MPSQGREASPGRVVNLRVVLRYLGRGLGRNLLSRGDSRENLADILINLLNLLEGTPLCLI